MTPQVSIIMAVKNAENHLRPCIDSILSQTYRDFELLCIYDSSTDTTWEILCFYRAKDPRVVLIQGGGLGPGGARNLGMSFAKGKYWTFWDSDEIFVCSVLEKMVSLAENTNAEVALCCSSHLCQEKTMGRISDAVRLDLLPGGNVFSASDCRGTPFSAFVGWAWDKLFLASYCRSHSFQFGNNYILEDGAFVFPALINANRIALIPEQLISHRVHIDSLEADGAQFNQHWSDVFVNAALIQENMKKFGRYWEFRNGFCRWLINFCLWVLRKTSGMAFDAMCSKMFMEIQGTFGFSVSELRKFCYWEDYCAYRSLSSPCVGTHYTHLQKTIVWKTRTLQKGIRYLTTGRGAELIMRARCTNLDRGGVNQYE